MARIAGVNIPDNKHAVISLTYIFGIGSTTAQKICSSVGIAPSTKISQLSEEQLDAVTGVSGSGPAYVYYLAEAMINGAEKVGLEPNTARALVRQTLLGAAHMLTETEKSPEQLRREVTSPGGTTEAGLKILQERRTDEAVIECIKAATDRSKQLGNELANQLKAK